MGARSVAISRTWTTDRMSRNCSVSGSASTASAVGSIDASAGRSLRNAHASTGVRSPSSAGLMDPTSWDSALIHGR